MARALEQSATKPCTATTQQRSDVRLKPEFRRRIFVAAHGDLERANNGRPIAVDAVEERGWAARFDEIGVGDW